MVPKNAILLGTGWLFLGVLLVGQGTGITQTTGKTLKTVPISQSQSDSGRQMYQDYCAACHEMDGTGSGPAAEFLKVPPPDLTTMAKRHNEKSVALKTKSVLVFGSGSKAHGALEMPLWGQLFNSLTGPERQVVQLRIGNLSEYVESIQKK
jgi:mono/diheme cytochrome c family protein